jgi:hypothetical protein
MCLHSDRMYDNLILGIHTMSIWFDLKTGCDNYPCPLPTLSAVGNISTFNFISIQK